MSEQFDRRAIPHLWANRSYSKVFCIGYNKTGTTSLEAVLRALGFRVPNLMEQVLRLVRQANLGNFRPLVEFVERYDAFQDNPFSRGVVYAQVDALFPGSKFILTVRDPEEWYGSVLRFARQFYGVASLEEVNGEFLTSERHRASACFLYEVERKGVLRNGPNGLEEDWSLLFDRDHCIDTYVRRNEEILRYFAGRDDDLLVIDLAREHDTSRLLDFLLLPTSLAKPLPRLNRTR